MVEISGRKSAGNVDVGYKNSLIQNALHSPEQDNLAWPSFLILDEDLTCGEASKYHIWGLKSLNVSTSSAPRRDIYFKPNAVVVCKVNPLLNREFWISLIWLYRRT